DRRASMLLQSQAARSRPSVRGRACRGRAATTRSRCGCDRIGARVAAIDSRQRLAPRGAGAQAWCRSSLGESRPPVAPEESVRALHGVADDLRAAGAQRVRGLAGGAPCVERALEGPAQAFERASEL